MSVPDPIDTWLVRAIMAYRVGRELPPAMSDGPSGELFRSRAQAFIQSRLTSDAHDQYVSIRDLARAAVTAARSGDVAESERRFAEAERTLAGFGAAGELLHLSRSWIDQAYAYLCVRTRDWQGAFDRLTSAMAADLALEDEFAYGIFHIGRVHTLHLWLRALGDSGDRAGAAALAQQIVDYVHGTRDTLPIGAGWSRERAAAVPDDLKLAMTLRIASEVGTQVAAAGDDAGPVFAQFTAWQAWDAHPVLGEVSEWARATGAFLAGDTRAFLGHAVPFLLKGRRESTLWYAVANALTAVGASLRAPQMQPFLDEVVTDVETWRQLPADVQAPGLFAAIARRAAPPYRHRTAAKRLHVFTVGLPRTGSTSLYTLFANFRAGNEFMERETITNVVRHHQGAMSKAQLTQYLRRRGDEGDLEMDSASFHHLYLDVLLDEHPDARFVMTIRDPYEWTNSYIKMIMGWHQRFTADGAALPQWMEDYGVMLFGEFSWSWVASRAAVAERLEPLAGAFVKHWADANRRTLARLPKDRSLILRTETLSASRDRVAAFAGVPASALTDQHHSNIHPDRSDLLKALGRGWVDARVREHGADVLALAMEGVPACPEPEIASRRA